MMTSIPPEADPSDEHRRPEEWGKAAGPEEQIRFLRGPQRRGVELLRALRIFREFMRGFRRLHFVGPCVTVFGSARFNEGHPYYETGRTMGAALARAGFPGERRKFRPHVTIAYLNGVMQPEVAAFCAMHGLFSCGPIHAGEFHLYESHLGRSGSHYEIVASYPLSSSR